ncbi:SDR family NAD(P)-dependent oxidoreductase [Oceanobacillus kimchii]|uniref:SDR family NAD(P)-dependent oxidoreductase n=1 Tax=Oceanobacillus kimchii TaxID=746691 RepID=UPI0021A64E13|nr:SDR family NAD(P)-dependent oxidoreductase [Oceanobacillus kimchii]MCT1578341.1 SDR family NAD(P)-dependent oxidoreductase [Oceanobacillus kimchii]MCT2134519.1 SDR family NAD(P)-dependent oxidoreductase [Oceanobacillus kimchii]
MIKQKYTAITGASSGIGYAAAKKFANRGKNIIIIARRETLLHQLKDEILEDHPEVDVVIKVADLSNATEVIQLYKSLKQYHIETWINNAGFGIHTLIKDEDLGRAQNMLHLNIEALTILSTLYVQDYANVEGTQLINISSAAGYNMAPTAVIYSATKFYVSSFTENLALELRENGAKMQAKVLAPAATESEFAKIANSDKDFDMDQAFDKYHTSEEMADFMLQLYDSDKIVGSVVSEDYSFELTDNKFPYLG